MAITSQIKDTNRAILQIIYIYKCYTMVGCILSEECNGEEISLMTKGGKIVLHEAGHDESI